MTPYFLALALAAQPAAPDASWIAGYWLSCGKSEVTESWSDPRGGVMIGTGLTLSGSNTLSWEYMRIAPSEAGLSFFGQPNDQAPAEFRLASVGERRLVFENKAHDFPQRILYWRDGETLRARIEGFLNGREQAQDWSYERAPLNSHCPRPG